MRRALVMLAVAFAASATGCMAGMAGHAAPPPAAAPKAREASGGMGAMPMEQCPMAVPGTQVAAADTPDGESITFTTSPDRAAELRTRVHAMADMHNRHHQGVATSEMQAMQHAETMGSGTAEPDGTEHTGMMPAPSRAVVEDVEGGARLVVTPTDPASLDQLRSTVRTHAQHMQESGTCGMGEGGMRERGMR